MAGAARLGMALSIGDSEVLRLLSYAVGRLGPPPSRAHNLRTVVCRLARTCRVICTALQELSRFYVREAAAFARVRALNPGAAVLPDHELAALNAPRLANRQI